MNRYVIGAALLLAAWWLTRKKPAQSVGVDGHSDSNPAIAGGDSYGTLTTVDVTVGDDSGAVTITKTELPPHSVTRFSTYDNADAVSVALARANSIQAPYLSVNRPEPIPFRPVRR